MSHEIIPAIRKPNGYLWRRASVQVAANSLEWIPRGKLLNMAEFDTKKGKDGLAENAHNRQRRNFKGCHRIR